MGQWLKAIGGYTVEQTGKTQIHESPQSTNSFLNRLLSKRSGILGDRLNSCMRDMDGCNSLTGKMASPRIHVHVVHYCKYMHSRVEQSYWAQIFCVL